MIHIAIVEDQKDIHDQLKSYFIMLAKNYNLNINIDIYDSAEKFLFSDYLIYDLVSLDIDLPGIDGIEAARKIRLTSQETLIIFVTNLAQMAIKGYEVHAFDFIIKPLNYHSIEIKLLNALKKIESNKETNLIIRKQSELYKINTNDLLYAEIRDHYLYYYLINNDIITQKSTIKDLENNLASLPFVRCNNSYLINLKHVDSVVKDEVKVGESWLKISRGRKKEFLKALANYMGGINK